MEFKKASTPSTSDKSTLKNYKRQHGSRVNSQCPMYSRIPTIHEYNEHQRHTLIRTGMHLRSRKMIQCNGFPNRFFELVRIFTVRLMMGSWRRLCIKFIEADIIERTYVEHDPYFCWKTAWWSQEKDHGQDAWNHIEGRNEYQIATCDDKGVFMTPAGSNT
jgi:hypothetical protein